LEKENDKSSKLTEPMLVMKRNKYRQIIPAGFDSVKVKKFKSHIFSPFVELIYKEKLTSVKFG